VLIFGRGLRGLYRSGQLIALGAGIAESLYAFLAFWGMSHLVDRFPTLVLASRAVAALILLGLGLFFALRRPGAAADRAEPEHEKSSFLVGFALTALNPTFIATWTAAVAILHSTGVCPTESRNAAPFAGGVLVGIVGWFWLMLRLMRRYKDRFGKATLDRVIRGVGVMLMGMGAWFGVRLVMALAYRY
jgi:threonine/homoserine/homoserine lactone efflux protein